MEHLAPNEVSKNGSIYFEAAYKYQNKNQRETKETPIVTQTECTDHSKNKIENQKQILQFIANNDIASKICEEIEQRQSELLSTINRTRKRLQKIAASKGINVDELMKQQTIKIIKKPPMALQSTVWVTPPSGTFEHYYQKLKPIGTPGSFGRAYKIKRLSDGNIFAVKEISKNQIYNLQPTDKMRESLLEHMKSEIDVMRRLNHKYIVNMLETYETKHSLYIIMEECRGGELLDRINKQDFKRFKEKNCKLIIKQICEALFYMHDKHNIVHCDLKPDNILFVDNSETSHIKIIDFGLSQHLPRLHGSLRQLCGTPYYTAPEVINHKYTHACDIWSVGVITYFMIFGFHPFYVDLDEYHGIQHTKEIYNLILKGFNPIVKPGYGAWFPKALISLISQNGMDFIGNLLEQIPGKRLTAKECLQHPWLNSNFNNDDYDDDEKDDVHDATFKLEDLNAIPFANWCISHKFKYAICPLCREPYMKLRPKYVENLKQLFSQLDVDSDGKISYNEFEYGMLKCKDLKLDKNKIKQMFMSLDWNKNGVLIFENLLDALVFDCLTQSDMRLHKAFTIFDINDIGKIQLDVLKKKIREKNVYDNIDDIFLIIDDVDLNGDGYIDYEEWLTALHPDFNDTPNWFWQDTVVPHKKNKEKRNDIVDNQSKTININDELIVKEGWMQKEGKRIRSWKSRYFKLQNNGIMRYYRKENDKNAIGTFNVKTLTMLKRKSFDNIVYKIYGIEVRTPNRNWKFVCKNNNERNEWIKAIRKAANLNDVKDVKDEKCKRINVKTNNSQLIVKEGWMQKEGRVIHSWKLRYFKLQKNGIMGYYNNENAKCAIAMFNIKKLTKLKRESWGNDKLYGIKVYTPHRDWKLLCKNDKERIEWIKAIQQV